MSRVKVSAIIKDSKVSKGKSTKESISEKLATAKVMENIAEDNRSELVKLISRAEDNAKKDIKSVFYSYVVKHTFAELRRFQRRYYKVIDDSDVTAEIAATHKRIYSGKRGEFHFVNVDKPLINEAAKVVKRLREGRKYTDDFSFIPSQTEDKSGNKVLEKKPVTDLHGAFMSLQRSVTAIYWEKIAQAAKERKEEENRVNELETLKAKVLGGKATPEEIIRFAQLAK